MSKLVVITEIELKHNCFRNCTEKKVFQEVKMRTSDGFYTLFVCSELEGH